MNTENDSLIGKQLGDYQVQSGLGEGGMARVYKAYHPRLRREVAIKIILSQIATREGFQARFEREAQVVASLEHPNIVSVYDFKEENNLTYLVMQYVGGGTLREQLRGNRPIEPTRAVNYTIQMARALHHAHQRGIVHRDVKPQNMLISSSDPNHLLLSDFGIAKLYGGAEDSAFAEMPTRAANDSELTNANQIIGTADYMAPEQATAKPVDARTDVYALGVVLFQMLTGEVPFHSTSLNGLIFQHVYTAPPSVRAKNPRLPEILAEITAKALAKEPSERFQTAEAMAKALEYANMHATNPLASLAMSNLATLPYQQAGPASSFAPPQTAARPPQQWPNTGSQSRQDSYATFDDRTTNARSRVTHPSGIAQPNTSVTSIPIAQTGQIVRKRPFPLSYLLLAAVLILGVVVLATRYFPGFPGLSGSTLGGQTNTSAAKAFIEDFQNNNRNWQIGSLGGGITVDINNHHRYIIDVSQPTNQATTAFAYPQKVGTLSPNFTLSATIQENPGAPNIFYGLAFRFTEGNSANVTCYALIIDNNGDYQIREYGNGYNNSSAALWSGQYAGSTGPHTLQVIGQGNNYTFTIDGKAIKTGATSYTLTNTDIQSGSLALVAAGPTATFIATSVQLSIP